MKASDAIALAMRPFSWQVQMLLKGSLQESRYSPPEIAITQKGTGTSHMMLVFLQRNKL